MNKKVRNCIIIGVVISILIAIVSTVCINAKNNKQYPIAKKEQQEIKAAIELKELTAQEIIANPKQYYGKKVTNYSRNGLTFRIFYVDKDNYFGDGKNTIYLKADISDTIRPQITYSSNTLVKKMNPIWSAQRGVASWNYNEKEAAWFCDPNNWSDYCDTNKANYAIGTPSVEMYIRSYNQTHDEDSYGNLPLECYYQTNSVPGYAYRAYGTTYNNGWSTQNVIDNKNYNGMYGENIWLASPSSNSSSTLESMKDRALCIVSDMELNGMAPGSIRFCPIVSLKSSFLPTIEDETYTVTLNTNGGTINNGNVTSYVPGTTTTLPTDVTKSGYTFGGWYANSSCTGNPVTEIGSTETGDKTYYAKWTQNTYTVTLNTNGGTINSGNVTSYVIGTTTTLPTDVTRSGYTFGGWYTNSSCTGNPVTQIGSTETGNKTYYAKWTQNTYTVTLNTNGGTINSGNVTSYVPGTTTTLPTNVTKTGYTFVGWYENSSCTGNMVTQIGSTETGNKTYYAKWTVNTYKIVYETNGGTINSGNVMSYRYGEGATLPTNVTKTGYRFGGWYANSSCTGNPVTQIGSTETGHKTYYAKWTQNTYTVTFKDGANVVKTQSVNYGTGATAPTLTRPGYVLRWDKNFNNITSDLEVNAIWLKDTDGDGIPDIEDPETLVNYKIEHYKQNLTQNGYDTPEIEIKQGNLGTTVSAEARQYQGFNVVTKPETIPSGTVVDDGSLTLKLYYDRQTYNIRYETNAGKIENQNYMTEYTYGVGGVLPTNVIKPGYTFGGWYDNAQLVGNIVTQITNTDIGDKTYYASWIAKGDTPYKVMHYKQEGTEYILEETDNLTARYRSKCNSITKAI